MKLIEDTELRKRLTKTLVLQCFRNTKLEDLHAGIGPSTKVGDYSDVKVVTPYREIPWEQVSRISDEEMKELIIDVVDKTFTFLTSMSMSPRLGKMEQILEKHDPCPEWKEPEVRYIDSLRMPGNYDSTFEREYGQET